MSTPESDERPPLDLEALAYQFITLYERWSEDRVAEVKRGAELYKLVETFTAEVKTLDEIVPKLKMALSQAIKSSYEKTLEEVGAKASEFATKEIERTVQRLEKATQKAEQVLNQFKENEEVSGLVALALTVGTTIAASLLIVWLLIPKPISVNALSDKQLSYIEGGMAVENIWPYLSSKEKKHLKELSNEHGEHKPLD